MSSCARLLGDISRRLQIGLAGPKGGANRVFSGLLCGGGAMLGSLGSQI
jgi:hypothetical protein